MGNAGVISATPKLDLLFRTRARAIANGIRNAIHEAPVRISTAAILIGVIWYGLYRLFEAMLIQLDRTPLEATIAVPMIFNFFFAAMLALLTFSNAIIAYSSLFSKRESAFLLTLPLSPRDLITFKFLESLVLSSWSVVLLGLPLMFAMSTTVDEPTSRILFLAFFIAFIPIPGALGLFAAWSAARFFPRKITRTLTGIAAAALAVSLLAGLRWLQLSETATEVWLRSFLARMSFVEWALLPNNWVATGIDHAMHAQFSEAFLYLGVTLANAFFLSWLAVTIVSTYFDGAYDRAAAGRTSGRRTASPASGGTAGRIFFYLPLPLRLIAAKDLRTFVRDPAQWSQLTILFGLLVLYLTNMPAFRMQFDASGWLLMLPFMNLCAVSLILATFTCRFVFPLVSLEGQKLWLTGVLPMRRSRLLISKFCFAMTVTLLVAIGALGIAVVLLGLEPIWAGIHLITTVSICFGLCGFSVGLGARLPMFDQTNPARIANGLGGTTNLLASIALVALTLAGVGIATYRSRYNVSGTWPDTQSLLFCASSVVISLTGGLAALYVGARHFEQVEV